MKNRLYGISYAFSKAPGIDNVAQVGAIRYSPAVVCYSQENNEYVTMQFPDEFKVWSRIGALSQNNKSYYGRLASEARENQERLIADFICALILTQLRKYADSRFTFIIKDAFETEKFVGRLGYLGLPLDKITIYFVSSNPRDLLTNYLAPFSENRYGDLSLLRGGENKLFGPFPEDEEATMLRTFFCTFSHAELYPLRVNLFSQFMDRQKLDYEHSQIKELFLSRDWTELYPIDGGNRREQTRLPTALIRCEDYIKQKILPAANP